MDLPDKTRADLGWDLLLEELAKRAHSVRGAALARALSAIEDIGALRARHDEVREARAFRDTANPLPLGGIRDIDEALKRAAKGGALDGGSLRDVASTLKAAQAVRKHLTGQHKAPRLLGRAVLLSELREVSEPIDSAFEGEGAGLDPNGQPRLTDQASQALGPLRRRALKIREELERTLNAQLDASHIAPHLQDRFFTQRDDRFVLPIRVDARSQVRGIVHGTSQSGQTVFIEPENVVDLNNRLKLAELEVADEERRILQQLSGAVQDALPQISVNIEILSTIDLIDAAAHLSSDLRAEPPEFFDTGAEDCQIDLRHARHPLMALAFAAENRRVVPNDIRVGFGRGLVISGPNAGGKTVALKTTGLLVLMAEAGLHIPAQEGSRLPRFSAIRSDVGDDQSLERNLSTFSAHILHLREFLATATPGVLVLLDEVAVGTDPQEGAALAQAVLEALADRGATVVLTTHYDRLKALPATDRRFENASVGFDVDRLSPTYQLHLGVPGASGAITVAQRLGLDGKVCARSADLVGEKLGLERLLEGLEIERQRMAKARDDMKQATSAAEASRIAAEEDRERAKEELIEARRGAHDEAVESLRRARLELDESRTVLRRRGKEVTPATLKISKDEISRAAEKVAQLAPSPDEPEGRAPEAGELRVGIDVWVERVRQVGRVISLSGKKVEVQVGALKLRATADELRIPDRGHSKEVAPISNSRRRGHNGFDLDAPPAAEMRGGFAVLNVRGERVDVALGMVEKFLDDTLRSGQEAVHIIHGHGTGALRDAIRRELSSFPGVTEIRPATKSEGGDGTTVISFK